MPIHENAGPVPPLSVADQPSGITVAQLAGQVYEAAPAAERCRLLQHLMQPLGPLSLVAVANGVFAKLWFRSGWHDLHIQPEDTLVVNAGDVIKLVDYVQQASSEVIDGLAQLVATSPMMAYSTAAALLVAALVRTTQKPAGAGEQCIATDKTASM